MKAIGCIYEPFEFITVELIQKIEEARKEYKVVGVGIPTDAYFYMRYSRKPIKPYSDRSQLAKALKGVNFVFPVDSETDLTSEIVFGGTEMTTVEIPKPDKIYEKKTHIAETPIEAFERGQRISMKETIKNFERKYEYIKNILQRYNETDKLQTLENLYQQYLTLDEREWLYE